MIAVPAALGYGTAGVDLIERAPREVEVRIERAQGHPTTFVEPIEDSTSTDLARRVPRGVTVMLCEPVPWRVPVDRDRARLRTGQRITPDSR